MSQGILDDQFFGLFELEDSNDAAGSFVKEARPTRESRAMPRPCNY
jgi:hypothetical protein